MQASEAKVVRKDITTTTFADFLDFAYTGDYESEGFSALRSYPKNYNLHQWCEKIKMKDAVEQHCVQFIEAYEASSAVKSTKPPNETLEEEDAEDAGKLISILEQHVNLFILATAYDVESLAQVCLVKIRSLFVCAPLTSQLTEATMALVPLVWKNTSTNDALRRLWLDWIFTDPGWFQCPYGEDMQPNFIQATRVDGFSTDFTLSIPNDYWD